MNKEWERVVDIFLEEKFYTVLNEKNSVKYITHRIALNIDRHTCITSGNSEKNALSKAIWKLANTFKAEFITFKELLINTKYEISYSGDRAGGTVICNTEMNGIKYEGEGSNKVTAIFNAAQQMNKINNLQLNSYQLYLEGLTDRFYERNYYTVDAQTAKPLTTYVISLKVTGNKCTSTGSRLKQTVQDAIRKLLPSERELIIFKKILTSRKTSVNYEHELIEISAEVDGIKYEADGENLITAIYNAVQKNKTSSRSLGEMRIEENTSENSINVEKKIFWSSFQYMIDMFIKEQWYTLVSIKGPAKGSMFRVLLKIATNEFQGKGSTERGAVSSALGRFSSSSHDKLQLFKEILFLRDYEMMKCSDDCIHISFERDGVKYDGQGANVADAINNAINNITYYWEHLEKVAIEIRNQNYYKLESQTPSTFSISLKVGENKYFGEGRDTYEAITNAIQKLVPSSSKMKMFHEIFINREDAFIFICDTVIVSTKVNSVQFEGHGGNIITAIFNAIENKNMTISYACTSEVVDMYPVSSSSQKMMANIESILRTSQTVKQNKEHLQASGSHSLNENYVTTMEQRSGPKESHSESYVVCDEFNTVKEKKSSETPEKIMIINKYCAENCSRIKAKKEKSSNCWEKLIDIFMKEEWYTLMSVNGTPEYSKFWVSLKIQDRKYRGRGANERNAVSDALERLFSFSPNELKSFTEILFNKDYDIMKCSYGCTHISYDMDGVSYEGKGANLPDAIFNAIYYEDDYWEDLRQVVQEFKEQIYYKLDSYTNATYFISLKVTGNKCSSKGTTIQQGIFKAILKLLPSKSKLKIFKEILINRKDAIKFVNNIVIVSIKLNCVQYEGKGENIITAIFNAIEKKKTTIAYDHTSQGIDEKPSPSSTRKIMADRELILENSAIKQMPDKQIEQHSKPSEPNSLNENHRPPTEEILSMCPSKPEDISKTDGILSQESNFQSNVEDECNMFQKKESSESPEEIMENKENILDNSLRIKAKQRNFSNCWEKLVDIFMREEWFTLTLVDGTRKHYKFEVSLKIIARKFEGRGTTERNALLDALNRLFPPSSKKLRIFQEILLNKNYEMIKCPVGCMHISYDINGIKYEGKGINVIDAIFNVMCDVDHYWEYLSQIVYEFIKQNYYELDSQTDSTFFISLKIAENKCSSNGSSINEALSNAIQKLLPSASKLKIFYEILINRKNAFKLGCDTVIVSTIVNCVQYKGKGENIVTAIFNAIKNNSKISSDRTSSILDEMTSSNKSISENSVVKQVPFSSELHFQNEVGDEITCGLNNPQ